MTTTAADSDRIADDLAARRLACSVFDRPVVLEAGAGTGKTTALVARLATWTLDAGWDAAREASERADDARIARAVLDGVVAITFTEKAAAEMGARLARALEGISRGEQQRGLFADLLRVEGDELRRRAHALSTALDRPVVHTIHAFCKALLAAHPIEARLAPQTTVDVDGRAVAEIAREVVDEHLAALATRAPTDDERIVFGLAIGTVRVEEALAQLAQDGVRPEDFGGDPCSPQSVATMYRDLATAVRAFLELAAALRSAPAQSVRGARELLEALAAMSTPHESEAARFTPLPLNTRKRLHDWSKCKFTAAEERALGDTSRDVAAAARELEPLVDELAALDLVTVGAAHRILRPLYTELRRRFVARGYSSYGDLLRDARDLLKNHPSLAAAERRRIRQVCVDEFQDTDVLQCDLVRKLVLEPLPNTRRPGLFLVGDPKQSIYGWRNADLAAYEGFVAEVLGHDGVIARLSVNYRSTRSVLDGVEHAIAPVMRAEPGVQPAYEPLVPARSDIGAPVERWISWSCAEGERSLAKTSAEEAYRIEADWIARDVERAVREGASLRDMALLLRTMSPIETYLAALRRAGVPYEVSGEKSYYRRREVLDAAALVRTIVDPSDALACMTFLRSSVVLVPDAAWIPLHAQKLFDLVAAIEDERDLPPALAAVARAAARVPEGVPGLDRVAGWEGRLVAALHTLAALRRSSRTEPADRFVENVRRWTLFEAGESARYLGRFRQAHLERFFERWLAELDDGDPRGFLRALRRAQASERDDEDARPRDEAASALQVMTIHRSKGLDFGTVYLAALHAESKPREIPLADLRDATCALFGRGAPGYGRVLARRARTDAAERIRTLYVAMTRAKDRLVLLGCLRERPQSRANQRAPLDCKSHLELLGHSADDEVVVVLASAAREGHTTIEHGGVTWRLPEPTPTTSERARPQTSAPIDVERMHADARRLAHAQPQARVRASMPWSRPASLAEAPQDDEHAPPISSQRRARAPSEAAAIGRALHRALELFDFAAPREREIQLRREGIELHVATDVPNDDRAPRRAVALFDRVVRGALFARLAGLGSQLVARELPFLLPPDAHCLGFVSGVIDLVYRDGERFVIADYKTDVVEGEDEMAARAREYAQQARAYPAALAAALSLEELPRFELWFLTADRIVVPTTVE